MQLALSILKFVVPVLSWNEGTYSFSVKVGLEGFQIDSSVLESGITDAFSTAFVSIIVCQNKVIVTSMHPILVVA